MEDLLIGVAKFGDAMSGDLMAAILISAASLLALAIWRGRAVLNVLTKGQIDINDVEIGNTFYTDSKIEIEGRPGVTYINQDIGLSDRSISFGKSSSESKSVFHEFGLAASHYEHFIIKATKLSRKNHSPIIFDFLEEATQVSWFDQVKNPLLVFDQDRRNRVQEKRMRLIKSAWKKAITPHIPHVDFGFDWKETHFKPVLVREEGMDRESFRVLFIGQSMEDQGLYDKNRVRVFASGEYIYDQTHNDLCRYITNKFALESIQNNSQFWDYFTLQVRHNLPQPEPKNVIC